MGLRATVHRTESRAGPDGGEGGRWGVVLGARPSGFGAHAGVARHARVCSKTGPAPKDWRKSLGRLARRESAALRLATRHDTAFGSPEFVEEMERKYGVLQLRAKPLGRPRKPPQAEAALTAAATVSA